MRAAYPTCSRPCKEILCRPDKRSAIRKNAGVATTSLEVRTNTTHSRSLEPTTLINR